MDLQKKTSIDYQIKQWIVLDNQIKKITEQLYDLREERQRLGDHLFKCATTNNLVNTTVQSGDDRVKFTNTRVSSQLTFKYVETSLGNIIKNEGQVKQIIEYLKTNRESKIVPEIKRMTA
jgi:hypothetical protein